MTSIPVIGAQVFIEPGQREDMVNGWFTTMKECGMKVCRIRMFEAYCRGRDGEWDFSLFDRAFNAAAANGVKVFGTIFPDMEGNGIGGFKFPVDDAHEKQIDAFTDALVAHFKGHPALRGWVLINEPGVEGVLPDTPYSRSKFLQWKEAHPNADYTPLGYPNLVTFDLQRFLLEYNTWYLSRIAARVRAVDPDHEIHVNNHQIFRNAAEYDFPAWRSFLDSLGASAHPSWHFGYFSRKRFGTAMAANCDIIRSGAGPIPWLITELQGGNNTYSAFKPFCPTPAELSRWMWTGIGTGAKGIIFWSLNPRGVGEEAGEWSLLDMQGRVSARTLAAAATAKALEEHKDLFASALPFSSPIAVLYTRESLWCELQVQRGDLEDPAYEGRHEGGAMKSASAIYEILLQQGLKPSFGEMSEYDWTQDSYEGKCIILSGQVGIPRRYYDLLREFVGRGGKLFIEGLSFWYDENMFSVFGVDFPLADVFGGTLQEAFCTPGDYTVPVEGCDFPVHLWDAVLTGDKRILRHSYGRGSVTWLPSMVSLGAIRSGNKEPLSNLLSAELKSIAPAFPIRFAHRYDGVSLHLMSSGRSYIAIVSSSNDIPVTVDFLSTLQPRQILFCHGTCTLASSSATLGPDATAVIYFDFS